PAFVTLSWPDTTTTKQVPTPSSRNSSTPPGSETASPQRASVLTSLAVQTANSGWVATSWRFLTVARRPALSRDQGRSRDRSRSPRRASWSAPSGDRGDGSPTARTLCGGAQQQPQRDSNPCLDLERVVS